MRALLRADFFKLQKSGLLWGVWGLIVLFVLLIMLADALVLPSHMVYPFPDSLLPVGTAFQSLGLFILVAYGAALVGDEYRYDTWKNLLTRHPGRGRFIVSKWLMLLITNFGGLVAVMMVALIVGFLLQATRAPTFHGGPSSLVDAFLLVLAQCLLAFVASAVALMGTVIGRSLFVGFLVGVVWLILDSQLPHLLSGSWKILSLSFASQRIQAHILQKATTATLATELLVVAAYFLLPVLIAASVFRQRDLLGTI